MFNTVITYWCIVFLTTLSLPNIYLAGLLPSLFIVASDITKEGSEPGLLARTFNRLAIIGLLPAACFFLNWAGSCVVFGKCYAAATSFAYAYAACLGVGVVGVIAALRFFPRAADLARDRFTARTSLERNRKTDVREIHKMLPAEIGGFDPVKCFPPVKRKEMFVGLDEHRRPVYLDCEVWKISHCLLTGRTRSGKGVAAQILLSQAIERGEYVVILDPKVDNWMPHIYRAACEKAGVPYRFVDLRQSAGQQINPFVGCDAETLENMLVGGFSLTEKGEAADFYRLADRKAARRTAAWLADHDGATARDVIAAIGGDWDKDAPAFLSYMQEMAELPAVNRPAGSGGVDIAEGVRSGGCLYVVGDMINPRIIRMQRMILLRLLFLAKNRDQINQGRTITVFADEFKVHISRPFITSLGASAGWGLHTILAFQSLQDLADCPADLDKDAVRGSVMENCGIQLSYAIKDPETAEWLAASTGTVQVDDESRQVRKNVALTETVEGHRNIRQAERYFIDTNMLMHMPKGCGVLSVAGRLPSFCYTSPVPAERIPEAVTPTAPAMPPMAAAAAAVSVAKEALTLDSPVSPTEPVEEIDQAEPCYYEPEPEQPEEPDCYESEATPGPLDLD